MSKEHEDSESQADAEELEPPEDAPDGYNLVFKEMSTDDAETKSESSDDDS